MPRCTTVYQPHITVRDRTRKSGDKEAIFPRLICWSLLFWCWLLLCCRGIMLTFSLLLPTVCCKVPRFATVVMFRLFSLFLELGVLLRSGISSALLLLPFLLSNFGYKNDFYFLFFRGRRDLHCFFLDAFRIELIKAKHLTTGTSSFHIW